MKIGIPKTLFGLYHYEFWLELLQGMGFEVIASAESDKSMADLGSKRIPHEFCLPVKVFIGHVLNLLDREADLILVPRMLSRGNSNFFCPKLIGLPEVVQYGLRLPGERIYSPVTKCNGLSVTVRGVPEYPRVPVYRVKDAIKNARQKWEGILWRCRKEGLRLDEVQARENKTAKDIDIGLLGYAYSLYDPFIGKGITEKLSNLGARIYTWEMLGADLCLSGLRKMERGLFWNFGRIILGAGLHFIRDKKINGLVYVSTFGCGPDSITVKILSLAAAEAGKPFLAVIMDEHTGESHLQTRLEAFTDLVAAQKEESSHQGHVSLSGARIGL